MSNPAADQNPSSRCPCGKHRAGDISHPQIISALRTNPYALRSLLHGLSDEQLHRRVVEHERTIAEIVEHLAASTAFYLQDTVQMLQEDDATLGGPGDLDFTPNSVAQMYQQFASNEARLAELLTNLSEAEWQHRGIIPQPDGSQVVIAVDDNAVHAVDHDREHLAEIKRLRDAMNVVQPNGGCVCGLHHAGDISHEQMVAEMRAHPRELATLLQGLDEETLTRPAPDGGWSIKQLAGHLRDGAATYLERTELMLNEDYPTMPRMSRDDEANYNTNDLGEMLADLDATDERFARLVEGLTAEQWQRTGVRKSAEGDAELVVDDTVVHHVDHEREHIAEIKKLLPQ